MKTYGQVAMITSTAEDEWSASCRAWFTRVRIPCTHWQIAALAPKPLSDIGEEKNLCSYQEMIPDSQDIQPVFWMTYLNFLVHEHSFSLCIQYFILNHKFSGVKHG